MRLLKTYSGSNFPKTYLVIDKREDPKKIVPFNVLYLFGDLRLVKGSLLPSHLPFSKGGQKRITTTVCDSGFCFYKWPGKILGSHLGDVLAIED